MARSLNDERRLLSAEEFALVEKSRHPGLGFLDDKELAELLKHIRERRDRARDIAAHQRREMRGKAAPRGMTAAADNTGTKGKRDHLAQAVQRLNKEVTRRQVKAAKEELMDHAKRALEMRRARAEKAARAPVTGTPSEGMREKLNPKARRQRSGDVLGKISARTKVAQAKRDSRGA